MDDIFDMFFYLENHKGWKVKVVYEEKENATFVEKQGSFFLKGAIPNKYIEVMDHENYLIINFSGPKTFLKSLDISSQEGFFIRVYDSSKEKVSNLDNLNFYYLYNIYENKRLNIFNQFKDLFDISDSIFSRRSKVYLFSNEPFLWKHLSNNIILKKKSILSVIGSGDFIFNSILLGCNNFSLFDINEYAYYYYEIKKAIIKRFNYNEFLLIYNDLSNLYYKFDEYAKYLSQDLRKKLDSIFIKYSDDIENLIKKIFWSDSYIFSDETNRIRRNEFIKNNNLYLKNVDEYNQIRKKLLQDNIEQSVSISSLECLNIDDIGKYDFIYLSNIGDYYDPKFFCEFLVELAKKCLTPTGKIILIYRTDNYNCLVTNKILKTSKYVDSNNSCLNNNILFCSLN